MVAIVYMGAHCGEKALARSDFMQIVVRLNNNKRGGLSGKVNVHQLFSQMAYQRQCGAYACQANTICKRWSKNKTAEIKKNQNTAMNSVR